MTRPLRSCRLTETNHRYLMGLVEAGHWANLDDAVNNALDNMRAATPAVPVAPAVGEPKPTAIAATAAEAVPTAVVEIGPSLSEPPLTPPAPATAATAASPAPSLFDRLKAEMENPTT